MSKPSDPLHLSDSEWRYRLGEERYRVMRQAETEPSFGGELLAEKRSGLYECAGCGTTLFKSKHKFDSGSGWPSFYDVAQYGDVELHDDKSHDMQRVEVRCRHCQGHLGHVFDDALDQPTGRRYCINSLALNFVAGDTKDKNK